MAGQCAHFAAHWKWQLVRSTLSMTHHAFQFDDSTNYTITLNLWLALHSADGVNNSPCLYLPFVCNIQILSVDVRKNAFAAHGRVLALARTGYVLRGMIR